jgi:predicted RNase H-like HicB family nuclease
MGSAFSVRSMKSLGYEQERRILPRNETDMLTAHINAALWKAHYEILPEGEGYLGRIESLQGVWAQADTLEACREELREVLEEWIVLGLKMGRPLPAVGARPERS